MRRRVAVLLPCCFALFALAAPSAHAGTIEQVTTTAVGVLPATATLTLSTPDDPGIAKVCLKSRSQGQLGCLAV